MTFWGNMSFQDFNSPNFYSITLFHENLMVFLVFMSIVVLLGLIYLHKSSFVNLQLVHNEAIEISYTVFPIIVLCVLAFFTMKLMFMGEEMVGGVDFSFKTMGRQWYWSYEYSDSINLKFDSYLKDSGTFMKLLDTDYHLILPSDVVIRNVMTSTDVIHSWTIPSLGVKSDVMPGRLNNLIFMMKSVGLFYGQCSEICGVNHAFMPICVESVPSNMFMKWMSSF